MLRLSHATAADLLGEGIEQGQDLLERAGLIGDQSDYESWKTTRKQWIERTAETLGRIYDGPQEALDFKSEASSPAAGQQWQIEYARDSNCVRAAIDILISFQHSLEGQPATDSRSEPDDFAGSEHDRDHDTDTDGDAQRERVDFVDDFFGDSEHDPAPAASAAEPEPADLSPVASDGDRSEDAPNGSMSALPEPADLAPAAADGDRSEDAANGSISALPEPADLAPAAADGDRSEDAANGSISALAAPRSSAGPRTDHARQVFLVHGRNDEVKHAVAGVLERTGQHEVTILNERPSDRRMLVEQFVQHPAELRYAVVLLTADDVGAPRLDSDREPYFSPRARQGVVFEMGFLVAALTPRCICVLYEDGVELPFDLDGIVYVRLDLAGAWQSKLLLHLRAAGFDYDLNLLAPI